MKRVILSLGVLLLACLALADCANAVESRPNILFILADDYRPDGVGCYGSDRFKGKTPNLDRLVATGMRFTRCYANPLCGLSRCTINTGRYVFRTGGVSNGSAGNLSPRNQKRSDWR